MADEKKPEGKPDAKAAPAPSGFSFFAPHPDPFVEIVWGIMMLLLIIFVLNAILRMFSGSGASSAGFVDSFLKYLSDLFWAIWPYIKILGVLLSILFSYFIYNISKKLAALRLVEKTLLYPEAVNENKNINPEWERVLTHVESLNEGDWRLSILEADIMLSALLDKLGLPGDTIADKLKAVERSDFTTIDMAWEGHKIRNQIAHESSFILSQHEAKRVVELFRQVFEEFRII
jgi:hypothetical protein